MKTLFFVPLLFVSGCAGMMGTMSPEQITAMAKEKNSSVACTDYTGAGGKFSLMFMNQEKIVASGGGDATVKCAAGEVTFKDMGKAVVAPSGAGTSK